MFSENFCSGEATKRYLNNLIAARFDRKYFYIELFNTSSINVNLKSRAYANLRQSSLDGLTGRGTAAFSTGAFTRPRPSSSETNLRKLAMGDQFARPGSALGLLQGL